MQDHRMGGKPVIRTAIIAAVSLAIGCTTLASQASAQSLTDRFKSLFGGGKPDEPPAAQGAPPASADEPQPDVNCPPVSIRAGASTYTVGLPGQEATGNNVRFQVTITKTARECIRNGGDITAHVGIQGRVIAGPAGAPASVDVPMRLAVVQGGVNEKVIATKAYRTTVPMTEEGSVPFSFVADDLVYPVPLGAIGDSYIFYVGFDPQLAAPEQKPKVVRKKK
jgi:hypothetical protein